MNTPGRLLAICTLLLLSFPGLTHAQYMYLDTNGNGIHDALDQIQTGAPTTVDIWIDTSVNRDGTPTVCDDDGVTPLSIFSWEVVLRAVGGTFEWGPLDNMLPISTSRACFADVTDTTNPAVYHNGWGGYLPSPPGRYQLARMKVKVLSGDPSIEILPYSPLQPVDLTAFGTMCMAREGDNTYKLGIDWFDAVGIGKLAADAGGPYLALPGVAIQFHSDGTANPVQNTLTYAWDFGDGSTSTEASPVHAYAAVGQYTVTLTVSDGGQTDSGSTVANIVPATAPTARAGGPYLGNVGAGLLFDGRGSSDPNGDPLTYLWDFGDGQNAAGYYFFYTYTEPRIYTVTLTVSDGVYSSTDVTTANIDPRPERPPVPVTGGPYTGTVGVKVHFNGGASHDPDNDPLTFLWIFGDGTQSPLTYPNKAYTEEGEYEVILEVSDGHFAVSSATTATIVPPVGAPPIAAAGGPYQGAAGRAIQFDGSRSSDPDGDPLQFTWSFGDGTQARGAVVSHAYASAGRFSLSLTVSDGSHETIASTTATVNATVGARAYLPDNGAIALGSTEAYQTIQVEPVAGSFVLSDVDVASLTITRADAPGVRIRARVPTRIGGDVDGNGVEEGSVAIRREDLRRILGPLVRPARQTFLIEGDLWSGGGFTASLECEVVPAQGRFAAVVRPNPFNPLATVSFVTSKEGRVSAHLFNLGGRLVRTIVNDLPMSAGRHDLNLEARSDAGVTLPSGVYFLKIDGPDGPIVTRIAVAK